MRVLESLGLKVKKPMILEIDDKGAVDSLMGMECQWTDSS
jgi:hypothetical protein